MFSNIRPNIILSIIHLEMQQHAYLDNYYAVVARREIYHITEV